jgi:hypothetical protein
MTIRTRLKQLEKLAKRAAPEQNRVGEPTDEGWLDAFEASGREGYFDREPDYRVALAFYRDALRRAKARGDFDPPEDFLPAMRNMPHLRLSNWRDESRFPDVREGWRWLAGMALRRMHDVPPVTEAEFRELADWLEANAESLDALLPRSHGLAIGKNYYTSIFNLRLKLKDGPRTTDAGELAEAVRGLRERYGKGFLLRELPGYQSIREMEERARHTACTPEQAIAYLQEGAKGDEPQPCEPPAVRREYRIDTAEDAARTMRKFLDEQLDSWS